MAHFGPWAFSYGTGGGEGSAEVDGGSAGAPSTGAINGSDPSSRLTVPVANFSVAVDPGGCGAAPPSGPPPERAGNAWFAGFGAVKVVDPATAVTTTGVAAVEELVGLELWTETRITGTAATAARRATRTDALPGRCRLN